MRSLCSVTERFTTKLRTLVWEQTNFKLWPTFSQSHRYWYGQSIGQSICIFLNIYTKYNNLNFNIYFWVILSSMATKVIAIWLNWILKLNAVYVLDEHYLRKKKYLQETHNMKVWTLPFHMVLKLKWSVFSDFFIHIWVKITHKIGNSLISVLEITKKINRSGVGEDGVRPPKQFNWYVEIKNQ